MCAGIAVVTQGRKGRTGSYPQLSVQKELLGTLHKMWSFSACLGLLYFPCFMHKTRLGPLVIFLENALEH